MRYHICTKYAYKDGHDKVHLFLLSNGVWYIKQSSNVFKFTSLLSEILLEIGQRWSLSIVRASAERPFLKEVFHTHARMCVWVCWCHIFFQEVYQQQLRAELKPEGSVETRDNLFTDLGDISVWDSFLQKKHQPKSVCVLHHHWSHRVNTVDANTTQNALLPISSCRYTVCDLSCNVQL